MKKLHFSVILLLVFSLQTGRAQDIRSSSLEGTLELLSERTDPEADIASQVEESLEPGERLDINRATAEELMKLSFLTRDQADNIVNYVVAYGDILSPSELWVIPGLDSAVVRQLPDHITIGPPGQGPALTLKNMARYGKHTLIIRAGQCMEKAEGYRTRDYAGSAQKLMFRYGYRFSDKLRIGFGGEKDAGEQFFRGSQPYGMDFYSGYIALENTGFIRSLVIGNYSASFGQGLTMGSGFSLGSIPGAGPPCRISQGVRPSGSMTEESYLRGVAVDLKYRRFDLSAFYSRHRRDASLTAEDTLSSGAIIASSLSGTGYHRTVNENAKKGALAETILGGNLSWRGPFYRFGITFSSAMYDGTIEPGNDPYRIHAFRGRSVQAAGADFIIRLKFITLFAEGARSFPGGYAFVGGIYCEPSTQLFFSVTGRSYGLDFCNLLANAPGQSGRNAGESGITLQASVKTSRRLNLTAYADLFCFPWLRYRVNSPSEGLETAVSAEWQAASALVFNFRYRYRQGMINRSGDDERVRTVTGSAVNGLRGRMDCTVSPIFRTRAFAEIQWGAGGDVSVAGSGYLAGQEVSFKVIRPAVSLSLRYVLFNIPAYGLRIYSYEPDVASSFSVPAYEGDGIRVVLNLSWDPVRQAGIQARYGLTWYSDRDKTGTGPETVSGPVRSEVKLQLRLRL